MNLAMENIDDIMIHIAFRENRQEVDIEVIESH